MTPRRTRPPLALAGIAAGALLAAACGPALDRSRTLTLAIDNSPASLDPRFGSDESSRRIHDLLFNGLFRVDDAGRPAGDLAAAWDRPDPLTVRVRLRPGVLFHDGTPLVAEDVVATYRSILDGAVASFRAGDLAVLRSVVAEGEDAVIFRLREPFAPILTVLNVPILRRGAGPETARAPIGTGPFRLIRYRKDEDLLLERFDRYFGGAPGVPMIRLRIIPAESARLLELLKGTVDLIINDLSPDQMMRVRGTPGYRVVTRPGRNYVYMAFNCEDPVLSDRRVRRAIAFGIDRRAIIDHLLGGLAIPATGMLPPDHWAYSADASRYDPDPARAARLLDEAGHPDPDGDGPEPRLRLSYKTTTSELAQQQAAILQAQLARVGIALDIRAFEWPTFYEDLKQGRFQVVVSNWTEIGDPDVYRLRFESSRVPPAGFNRGRYRSDEADRLIEAGARTLDEDARRPIYAALQRLLSDDLPYVSLWHRDVTAAMRERVRNFRLTSGADFQALRDVELGP